MFCDVDEEARAYSLTIASIESNEKLTFDAAEFKNSKGNSYPAGVKIKTLRFADAEDTTEALLYWKYTPVYSNPAGSIFKNSSYVLQFYKYGKEGYVKTNQDTMSYLHNGKFHMEDDKIVIECGKWIWDGYLEDDELKIQIREMPESASFFFVGSETLYRVKSSQGVINNPLPDENPLDYETVLLNVINSQKLLGKSFDSMLDEFIQIYHNADYQQYKDDEFAWHDKKQEFTKEYNSRISSLKDEYTVRVKHELGDYDFEKEGFAVDFSDNEVLKMNFVFNDVQDREDMNLAYLERNYAEIYQILSLSIPSGWFSKPVAFTVPMERAKAQEFLNARKNAAGEADKSVLCIVHARLSSGFYRIDVYDNETDMNLLYTGSIKRR